MHSTIECERALSALCLRELSEEYANCIMRVFKKVSLNGIKEEVTRHPLTRTAEIFDWVKNEHAKKFDQGSRWYIVQSQLSNELNTLREQDPEAGKTLVWVVVALKRLAIYSHTIDVAVAVAVERLNLLENTIRDWEPKWGKAQKQFATDMLGQVKPYIEEMQRTTNTYQGEHIQRIKEDGKDSSSRASSPSGVRGRQPASNPGSAQGPRANSPSPAQVTPQSRSRPQPQSRPQSQSRAQSASGAQSQSRSQSQSRPLAQAGSQSHGSAQPQSQVLLKDEDAAQILVSMAKTRLLE